MVRHHIFKNVGKAAKIGHWQVIFHAVYIESGFFNRGGGGDEGRLEV